MRHDDRAPQEVSEEVAFLEDEMTARIKTNQWHKLVIGSKQELASFFAVLTNAYIKCRQENTIPSDANVMAGEDPATKKSVVYFPPELINLALILGADKCEAPNHPTYPLISDAPSL